MVTKIMLMLADKLKLILVLCVLIIFSYYFLDNLSREDISGEDIVLQKNASSPDYTMQNFTTITTDHNGHAKHKLNAMYLAHYPDNNTNQLQQPKLEIFRANQASIFINANRGWVTSKDNSVLLKEKVYVYQHREDHMLAFQLLTEEATIWLDAELAETDKKAILISQSTVTNAVGMRAHFKQQRIEFLNNVHTTIKQKDIL